MMGYDGHQSKPICKLLEDYVKARNFIKTLCSLMHSSFRHKPPRPCYNHPHSRLLPSTVLNHRDGICLGQFFYGATGFSFLFFLHFYSKDCEVEVEKIQCDHYIICIPSFLVILCWKKWTQLILLFLSVTLSRVITPFFLACYNKQ